MDLRLSKRSPADNLLELYLPESPLLEKTEDTLYESPALEKRDNMLRLSKRDLLRLSKRDLLRLSKRDLLRLSKRAEEARNKQIQSGLEVHLAEISHNERKALTGAVFYKS